MQGLTHHYSTSNILRRSSWSTPPHPTLPPRTHLLRASMQSPLLQLPFTLLVYCPYIPALPFWSPNLPSPLPLFIHPPPSFLSPALSFPSTLWLIIYVHRRQCTWIIDNNLLPSETFCGNFSVLCPPVCKLKSENFPASQFLRKADKCFGVCTVN